MVFLVPCQHLIKETKFTHQRRVTKVFSRNEETKAKHSAGTRQSLPTYLNAAAALDSNGNEFAVK